LVRYLDGMASVVSIFELFGVALWVVTEWASGPGVEEDDGPHAPAPDDGPLNPRMHYSDDAVSMRISRRRPDRTSHTVQVRTGGAGRHRS
jgi:hypothetical protein